MKSSVIAIHVEVDVAEVIAPCMIMIAVHSHGRRCHMRKKRKDEDRWGLEVGAADHRNDDC